MWGYKSTEEAQESNTIEVKMNGAEIKTILSANWGWTVYNSKSQPQQIWAKWTISQEKLWKLYLTSDLYDPEIWDEEEQETWDKLIEKGIGRYVYAVYKKPNSDSWATDSNKTWTYYNIAYTVKQDGGDTYYTKIVWDYDSESCFDDSATCPDTLIGSKIWSILENEQVQWTDSAGSALSNYSSTSTNQWIPYPVWDFE